MPDIPKTIEREIGHAGLNTSLDGIYFDDHETTEELRWPQSVQVYDRMRREESKVQAMWRALILPIRRTSFRIEPNGARDDVVSRLARDLSLPIEGDDAPPTKARRKGRFIFGDHLRLSLLDLLYGHQAFEQVFVIEDDGYARLRKLAPRMPQTISEIKVAPDGGLVSIKQHGRSGSFALNEEPIPVDRLVWYANDREDGWLGRSILRPVYRNFLLRGRFYRVDAGTKERNGMGVPVLERIIAQAATPDEITAAEDFVRKFRAGEYSGGQTPYGYRLRLVAPEGPLPSALESAQHHGEEISSGVLQGFLDLGRTETGSRALGESFIDFYTMTENAVLADHLDIFNEHVIEDWVDHNYGEDEPAPLVIATEIGAEQAPTAESIKAMIEVGAIKPDRALRHYLRRSFRLPKEDEEAESKEPTGQTYQYDLDYQIVTVDERRAQIGLPPKEDGSGAEPPVPPEERLTLAASNAHRKRRGLEPITASILQKWRGKKLAAATEPRTFRRQLFDHEIRAATDFTAMEATWQSALDNLTETYKDVRTAQVESLLEQIRELVESGDIAALGAMTVDVSDATSLLEERMTQLADEAADAAIAEAKTQGRTIPKPDLDSNLIAEHAQRVAMLMGSDLATVAGRKAGENAALGGAEAASRVLDHIDSLTDTYLTDNLGGALTTAQNQARLAVIEEGDPQEIFASELLDDATCANCADIDGKEYASLDEATSDYPSGGHYACLGGSRCRGTIVVVHGDES